MTSVIKRGNTAPQEQPGSGMWERQRGAARRFTLISRGDVEALRANIPKPGDTVNISGIACRVVTARLVPEKGNLGTLTVVGTKKKGETADEEETWEVEMAQIEKPLLSHPDFSGVAATVLLWREGTDVDAKGAFAYKDSEGSLHTLSGAALLAAQKIAAGVESYLCFAPVIRKTTVTDDDVECGVDLGKICSSPLPSGKGISISGTWQWLKTCDNDVLDSDGVSVHVEEWTGADNWDPDLYETAGSAS